MIFNFKVRRVGVHMIAHLHVRRIVYYERKKHLLKRKLRSKMLNIIKVNSKTFKTKYVFTRTWNPKIVANYHIGKWSISILHRSYIARKCSYYCTKMFLLLCTVQMSRRFQLRCPVPNNNNPYIIQD